MSLDCEGGVGAVCDLECCDIFDFLPWYCGDCGGRYCAAHRLACDHKCNDVAPTATDAKGDIVSSNTLYTPNSSRKNYIVDSRKAEICDVCGNEDCLLHKLLPQLAAQIAAERAAALARRVWTGGGASPAAAGSGDGYSDTASIGTSSSAKSAIFGNSRNLLATLPWRIGKLSAKQNKDNTTAAGTAKNTTINGYATAASAATDTSRATPAAMLNGHTVSLVCVEVDEASTTTTTATVTVRKATFSHGVSVGYAADALASLIQSANGELRGAAISTSPSASSNTTPRPQASLFLQKEGPSFELIKSVDGQSAYLIDHLKRTTSGDGKSGNSTELEDSDKYFFMEKLLFVLVVPQSVESASKTEYFGISLLQQVSNAILAAVAPASAKKPADTAEGSPVALSFPQFEGAKETPSFSTASTTTSSSTSSLSDRMLRQQIAAYIRFNAAATAKKADAARPQKPPTGEATPATADNEVPAPASFNRFAGIDLYNDEGDDGNAKTPVFPSSVLGLPAVIAPRAAPINSKDPLVARMGAQSKALVGVQLLPLLSSAAPGAIRHKLGKSFCMFLDGKWSLGRVSEKLKAEGGITGAGSWQLVLLDVTTSAAACTSTPPFSMKRISKDLSALAESVGIANGAMLLFIEVPPLPENTEGGSEHGVPLPQSLITSLSAAFGPSPIPNKPPKLLPKVEAKVRKDCVVQ